MPKSFLIDTSRCTACRGCQIACKEWNELPANKTKQTGTHQNPPDLNANNYKLVRFNEYLENGTVKWYFFPDQCRHCLQPPCKETIDGYVQGAAIRDETTGAVVFNSKTQKAPFEEVRNSCPYDIPRQAADGSIVKCTMCNERVTRGLLPACVKACPTGTMNFGERQEMLDLAGKRLAELQKTYPKAILADPEDVSVIFLLLDEPNKYHKFAQSQGSEDLSRKQFLAQIFAPITRPVQRMGQLKS
jgi:formate dehydrogenase iron-sulfur subunit